MSRVLTVHRNGSQHSAVLTAHCLPDVREYVVIQRLNRRDQSSIDGPTTTHSTTVMALTWESLEPWLQPTASDFTDRGSELTWPSLDIGNGIDLFRRLVHPILLTDAKFRD